MNPETQKIPRIKFTGTEFADTMGIVFAENLEDLLMKYEDGSGSYAKGFLHTSTLLHKGTCYYDQMWSRDVGRGLQELARLGFVEQAQNIAAYLIEHKNFKDHWGRIANIPMDTDYELDGNTHVLCGIYRTWVSCGKDDVLGRYYLEHCKDVFAWLTGLMDNSPFGSLIPCISELAGNPCVEVPVYAIYPNYGAWISFCAFSHMADICGDSKTAQEYQAAADRLMESMKTLLVSDGKPERTKTPAGVWLNGFDGETGEVYETANFGATFSIHHWTRQLPFIQNYDIDINDLFEDSVKDIHQESYRYIRSEMAKGYFFRKYGFVSNTCWTGAGGRHDDTMCGYGQNYFSQAALTSDDVNTYGKCLEGIARLAYDGDVIEPRTFEMNPWVLHECFSYEDYEKGYDHTYGTDANWEVGIADNPGDEGNLVQACETLKTISMVIGVSIENGTLVVKPRLPWKWDSMELREYPIYDQDGKEYRINLLFRHERWLRKSSLEVKPIEGISKVRVRFGPYPAVLRNMETVSQDGFVENTQTATWIWQEGKSKIELQL